jgi:hypothetical protein
MTGFFIISYLFTHLVRRKKADDDELVQWLQNHNVLARVECPIHPDANIGDNGRCKVWIKRTTMRVGAR